ncbi:glycosyltransferase family protein [Lamprocystis purpurea]|jgi:hypothetical protein|uniref:hypothetical protein n=1 Tax=Lamprocystis purpurea TaxID=61598 RepID=UPI000372F8B2|nr:hypothetical protein [Lamprocystis purpurea]
MKQRRKRFGPPAGLRERVVTSGRRWETQGPWRTVLLWRLRFAYRRGAPAQLLAERYGGGPPRDAASAPQAQA